MSSPVSDPDRFVTLDELADYGFVPADVRLLCPYAVEYTALDGKPCWLRDDLTELFGSTGKEESE